MSRQGNPHGHRDGSYSPTKRFRYEGHDHGGFAAPHLHGDRSGGFENQPRFHHGEVVYTSSYHGYKGPEHRPEQIRVYEDKPGGRVVHQEIFDGPGFNKVRPRHPWSPGIGQPGASRPFPSPARAPGNIRKPFRSAAPPRGPHLHDATYKFRGHPIGERELRHKATPNPPRPPDYRSVPSRHSAPATFAKDRQYMYRSQDHSGFGAGPSSPHDHSFGCHPTSPWSAQDPANVRGGLAEHQIKQEASMGHSAAHMTAQPQETPHVPPHPYNEAQGGSAAGGGATKADPRLKSDSQVTKLLDSKESLLTMMEILDKDIADVKASIGVSKQKEEDLNSQFLQAESEASESEEEDLCDTSSKTLTQKPADSFLDFTNSLSEKLGLDNYDLIQDIYNDNKAKVVTISSIFDKLNFGGKTTAAALYNQPSDLPLYHKNIQRHLKFRRKLINSLRLGKLKEIALRKKQSVWFEKQQQIWQKRVDKLESNPRRKARMTRLRGFHEREFPEIKKQREQQERLNRFGSRSGWGAFARSEAELEEIVDNLSEIEATEKQMYLLAVEPPLLLDKFERRVKYLNQNGLIHNVPSFEKQRTSAITWSSMEKQVFRSRFAQQPKNFIFIASGLERKTVADCVLHYYLNKKKKNFKPTLRKTAKKRKLQKQMSASIPDLQQGQRQRLKEKDVDVEDDDGDDDIDDGDGGSVASGGCGEDPEPAAPCLGDREIPSPIAPVPPPLISPLQIAAPPASAPLPQAPHPPVMPAGDPSLSVEELISKHLSRKSDHVDPSRWSESEMAKAVEGLKRFGRNWLSISRIVQTKSEAQCKNFYSNYKRKFNLESILGIARDQSFGDTTTTLRKAGDIDALLSSIAVQDQREGGDGKRADDSTKRPLRSHKCKDVLAPASGHLDSSSLGSMATAMHVPLVRESTATVSTPHEHTHNGNRPTVIACKKQFPSIPPPPLTPVTSSGIFIRGPPPPMQSQLEEINLQSEIPAFQRALDVHQLTVAAAPSSAEAQMTVTSINSSAAMQQHYIRHETLKQQQLQQPRQLSDWERHGFSSGSYVDALEPQYQPSSDLPVTAARDRMLLDLNLTANDMQRRDWNRRAIDLRNSGLSLSPRGFDHGAYPGSFTARFSDEHRRHHVSSPHLPFAHDVQQPTMTMATRPRTVSELYERAAIIPDVILDRPSSAPDPLRSHRQQEPSMHRRIASSLASQRLHSPIHPDASGCSGSINKTSSPADAVTGGTRYGIVSGIAPRPASMTSITGNMATVPAVAQGMPKSLCSMPPSSPSCQASVIDVSRSHVGSREGARNEALLTSSWAARGVPITQHESKATMFRPWDDRPVPTNALRLHLPHDLAAAHYPLPEQSSSSARCPVTSSRFREEWQHGPTQQRQHGTPGRLLRKHATPTTSDDVLLSPIIPFQDAEPSYPSPSERATSTCSIVEHSDSETLSADEGYQYLSTDDDDGYQPPSFAVQEYQGRTELDNSEDTSGTGAVSSEMQATNAHYVENSPHEILPEQPEAETAGSGNDLVISSTSVPVTEVSQHEADERQPASPADPQPPTSTDVAVGEEGEGGVSSTYRMQLDSDRRGNVMAADTTVLDNARSAEPVAIAASVDESSTNVQSTASPSNSEEASQRDSALPTEATSSSCVLEPSNCMNCGSSDVSEAAATEQVPSVDVGRAIDLDQPEVGSSDETRDMPSSSLSRCRSNSNSPQSTGDDLTSTTTASGALEPSHVIVTKSDGECSASSCLSLPSPPPEDDSSVTSLSCFNTVPITPPGSPPLQDLTSNEAEGICPSTRSLSLLSLPRPTPSYPVTAFPYSSLSLNVHSRPSSHPSSSCPSPECTSSSNDDISPNITSSQSDASAWTMTGLGTVSTQCSPSGAAGDRSVEAGLLTYEPLSDAEIDQSD